MKIKMVDVAKRLGISKATVSLAVNGKPGVNEQTRQKVLECIKELEKNKDYIDSIIKMNAEKAQRIAQRTLSKVHRKIGFPDRIR